MMVNSMIAKTLEITVGEAIGELLTILTTFRVWDSMQSGYLQSSTTEMEGTTDIGEEIFTSSTLISAANKILLILWVHVTREEFG